MRRLCPEAAIGATRILDLTEARRVRAARAGDAVALRGLWAEVVDDLYAICCALLPEPAALDTLVAARASLERRRLTLQLREGFREQSLAAVWAELSARLRPAALAGISAPEAVVQGSDPSTRVAQTLRAAPPPLRLVWVFSTLGGVPAATLAAWSGQPEREVRRARAELAWSLLDAMKGRP